MSIIRFTAAYQGELSNSKPYRVGDVADFPQIPAHQLVKEKHVALFDKDATPTAQPPWPADNHPWMPGYVPPQPAPVVAPKHVRHKDEDV